MHFTRGPLDHKKCLWSGAMALRGEDYLQVIAELFRYKLLYYVDKKLYTTKSVYYNVLKYMCCVRLSQTSNMYNCMLMCFN